MNIIWSIVGTFLVIVVWSVILSIGDWIERKTSPSAFKGIRWIAVYPLAVLGFLSAPLAFQLGSAWAAIAYPAFVGTGMVVAPVYRRWKPGIPLLFFALLAASSEIVRAHQEDRTGGVIATTLGIIGSFAVFWVLRNGDKPLTEEDRQANIRKALGYPQIDQ